MRLFEHEAKEILGKYLIPVPQGKVVSNEEGLTEALKVLPPARSVVKAQILSGGRGKAGGILFADSPEAVRASTNLLLGKSIKGFPVKKVLIEPALDMAQEIYLGITIDRLNYRVAVIGCAEGGVEIEELARRSPEKIVSLYLTIDEPLFMYQCIEFGQRLGFHGKALIAIAGILGAMMRIFYDYDAKLVEINPLALLHDGSFCAADARMSVDEDALFRHPELETMGVEDRHEEGEMTERERRARELGIPYLDLEGDIGMFPGGAGFGIASIDLITDLGGRPANFMDSGGGPTPERIAQMLMLLEENPRVKAIFGARFGGVSRCDDFAKGVVMFLKTGKLTKPIVMRMTGNMWQEGVRIFEEERKHNPHLFDKVEIHGIETPIEEIARRAVELAQQAGSRNL
jgi:succinyl-CoA synthetase beta subunit